MAVIPAMPQMARTIAAGSNSALIAQLITTLPAAVMAVSAPFTGWGVRKIGFRPFLLMSLLLYVVAGLAALVAQHVTMLIVSRLFLGLAGGGVAALPIALAGNFEPAVRDRLIGFAASAGGITGVVTLNLGGLLVAEMGWRGPFLLYAVGVVVLVCALLDRNEPQASEATAARAEGQPNAGIAPILHLYVLLFCLSIGFYAPSLAGPFLLDRAGVFHAAEQGMLLSIFAFSSIMAASAFGFFVRHWATMGVAAVAAMALAAGLLFMAYWPVPMAMGLGFILCGIGAGFAAPAVISDIMKKASADVRAKAMGLKVTAIFLAQFMTPLFLHPLQSAFGLGGAMAAVSMMLLLTAVWALWLNRRDHGG